MEKRCSRNFKIKGISLRIDNTFYVDVEPSEGMYLAYIKKIGEYTGKNADYEDEYNGCFLNVAYSLDKEGKFNLSSFFSEYMWDDIPYECSDEEKKAVHDFIMKWKDKVPENPNHLDDSGYTHALSDNIPWKKDVLR